ncbi:MAG TPA: hypothetical protein VGU45_15655 [Microvirga sp.]|nr:hypothetical protein [Microvirga sp.]
MLSRFGIEASQAAQYVIAFVIILVLVALFGLVLRRLTGGRLLLPGQDRGRARQPRLGIVDIYDLDRQRQLILLRRDNVEHLLLIGGPNDVVIETNIVRVAASRSPAAAQDAVLPGPDGRGALPDATLDGPARPQIETNGRPSIEAQLAARLGSFVNRPGEDRAEGPAPAAAIEPVLKPSAVTLATPPAPPAAAAPEPAPAPAPVPPPAPAPAPLRAAPPPRPEPVAAPARPAPPPPPPPPRPASEAFMARPIPPRPAPVPPPAAPAAPPAPPARQAPQPASERNQDAAVLSDMAKQLEEALRRPSAAPAPAPNRVLPALDAPVPPAPRPAPSPRPEPLRAEPPAPEAPRREPPRPEPMRPDPVRPEPVRPEPPRPAPAPVPPPAPVRAAPPPPPPPPPRAAPPAPPPPPAPPAAAQPAQQARPSDDPFSVDEIEAEFARLLGRPVGGSGKN